MSPAMRKNCHRPEVSLIFKLKGVKLKCAMHMNQNRPSLVANCTARFSQDIVHESLMYTDIIYTNTHIANMRAYT